MKKPRKDTMKDGTYWVRCKELCEGDLMLLDKQSSRWWCFGMGEPVPYQDIKEIVSRVFPNRVRDALPSDKRG